MIAAGEQTLLSIVYKFDGPLTVFDKIGSDIIHFCIWTRLLDVRESCYKNILPFFVRSFFFENFQIFSACLDLFTCRHFRVRSRYKQVQELLLFPFAYVKLSLVFGNCSANLIVELCRRIVCRNPQTHGAIFLSKVLMQNPLYVLARQSFPTSPVMSTQFLFYPPSALSNAVSVYHFHNGLIYSSLQQGQHSFVPPSIKTII